MSEGYKNTSLGDIPKSWELIELGEILNVNTGNKNAQDSVDNGKYPFFTRSVTTQRIDDFSYDTEALLIAGEGIFKVKHFSGKFDVHQRTYILTSKDEKSINLIFFQNQIQSRIEKLVSTSVGSTVQSLRKPIIQNLQLVSPPLPEQQKIAEILSTVDEKIEAIDQRIVETQELKKGLMQQLLTKGIGHTKFKDSPLGEIPESWEVSNLESHSQFITKGSTPTTYGFDWQDSGVKFLRSECVSPNGFIESGAMHISEEANNAMERSKIKGGDILMTITGNVGRVCIFPLEYKEGNINQHIARIRIDDSLVLSQFIFQYLSQTSIIQDYLKITTGQAYPQLSLKQVRETKIPLPPITEQKKIADILSTVDDKLQIQQDKKTEYRKLKKGLMQQLLTGKIRVKI